MNARRLVLTAVALLAIAAPAGQACNIVADKDAAVRMASTSPGRSVLSTQRTSKTWAAVISKHRVGEPWPSLASVTRSSALHNYPR